MSESKLNEARLGSCTKCAPIKSYATTPTLAALFGSEKQTSQKKTSRGCYDDIGWDVAPNRQILVAVVICFN